MLRDVGDYSGARAPSTVNVRQPISLTESTVAQWIPASAGMTTNVNSIVNQLLLVQHTKTKADFSIRNHSDLLAIYMR